MTSKGKLTPEILRDLLDYDENTGEFRWKVKPQSAVSVGDVAGTDNGRGYVVIRISRVGYLAHRLAWLWAFGEMPDSHIDHLNGVKSDNRLCNLRLASRSSNMENQRRSRSDSKTGLLGVSPCKGRYMACIKVKGKSKYLGRHRTPEEAHEAYVKAKRKLHGGCTI